MAFLSNSMGAGISMIILFALMQAAVIIFGVMLWTRHDGTVIRRSKTWLALILIVGVVLRIIFTFTVKGYRDDFNVVIDAISGAYNGGLNYYSGSAEGLLSPLTYLIYLIFGGPFATVLSNANVAAFVVKLPLIVADCFSAVLLYMFMSKKANGLILAGVFSFSPIFMILSTVWANPLSLTVCFILLALYLMAKKKYFCFALAFMAALLTDKIAMCFMPCALIFLIVRVVLCIKNAVKKRPTAKEFFTNNEYALSYKIFIYMFAALAAGYVVSLFMIGSHSYNPFDWIYQFFIVPFSTASVYSQNALNVFSLLMKNGEVIPHAFPTVIFACIFAVIIYTVTLLLYLVKRNRAAMVLCGTYGVMTYCIYYLGFSAISIILPLAMLLASFALLKDKRLIRVFLAFSTLAIIQSMLVMTSADYLNFNNADYFIGADYAGSTTLSGGYAIASAVFSGLTALCHVYFTAVVLDVTLADSRMKFDKNEYATFSQSAKNLFTGRRVDKGEEEIPMEVQTASKRGDDGKII